MQAFRCDRCKTFYEGDGRSHYDIEIAWSKPNGALTIEVAATIHTSVINFDDPSRDVKAEYPEFCNECYGDMLIIAIRQLRPNMIITDLV